MYNNYNGKYYYIPRLERETDKSYNIRKWIISKLEPNNQKDFLESCKIAKLFINKKLLSCEYNNSINSFFLEKIPEEFF